MAKITDLSRNLKSISGEIAGTVIDMSGKVKSAISGYMAKTDNDASETDEVLEINTIGQLNNWIASTLPGASSGLALLLQEQINALNNIETPILIGMTIDNILAGLYKALEIAESENEKISLRESFASLLQSIIFVSEARLQYDIKKNKEAAIQMLQSAGDLITQSVTVAVSAAGGGACLEAAQCAGTLAVKGVSTVVNGISQSMQASQTPVINNVMSPKLLEVGVAGYLLSAKKKQEMLNERVKDHNQMLNNLFKTLDRHFDMIGPSIQIHGMLSRYADQLIEVFINERNEEIETCTAKFAAQMKQIVDEMNISIHQELRNNHPVRRAQALAGIINTMKDIGKKQEALGYNEVLHLYNFLKARYNSLSDQIAGIKTKIAGKQNELGSLDSFQQSSIKALLTQISGLEKKVRKLNISLSDIEEKTRIVEGIILPAKKRIEEYSGDLHRIAEKYAIC